MSAQQFATRLGVVGVLAVLIGAESPSLRDEDPLPIESQWKGKLTQVGTHPEATFPPELEATLTVTRRDGDEVEAELRETMPGMDITFLCKGHVARNADRSLSLELKSHGVKGNPTSSIYLIDVPYTARITGDTIKGSWKYVDRAEGIDLRGDYSLTRE